ncbi:MAG: HAMP domain-containing sensor histidine kinase [Candidatus Firestonebacteria bacterium]
MKMRGQLFENMGAGNEVDERDKWFIDLRWLAILGVPAVVTVAGNFFGEVLPVRQLYLGVLVLAGYNFAFLLYWRKLVSKPREGRAKHKLFSNVQVATDLVMLTYFLHFSGSIENPFVYFFIFHMVIAGILLSNRSAYAHGVLVMLLIGSTALLENLKVLPHYHLSGFPDSEMIYNFKYVFGALSVLGSTLFITIFMSASIVNKLRDREAKLAVANKMLAEQDRLKSQYVLTVSHDLKSSVSTIQSCLKVVLKGMTGPVAPKTAEMLARAEKRSLYMLDFISDLLNLSSIRTDRNLRKTLVSISMIAERTVEQIKHRFTAKNLKFEFLDNLEEAIIYANEDSIERVFINLLENAVRYTPSGGRISLSLSNREGKAETTIKDNGIGISEEDQQNLFNDFYRAENARMIEKDGTGLGLSIVKQILEAHEGKIWFESTLGQGSRFVFSLPVVSGGKEAA